MPQHGLGGQAHLAEQALGPAARKVEHRLGVGRGGAGVADDGDVVLVLDVQQCTRGFFGQATGHLLVDEVDDLFLDRRGTQRGGWRGRLLARCRLHQAVQETLRLETHAHHRAAHQLDGLRAGGVEEHHGRRVAGPEALLAHLAQQVAHVHRDVAEVDLHRARALALVAHGAVVGDVFEVFPVFDADTAARLLFVQKGFDQQRGGQDLVARGTCVAHTGLHLPQRRQSLMLSLMAPMSLCCMISDSWPISPKLGV